MINPLLKLLFISSIFIVSCSQNDDYAGDDKNAVILAKGVSCDDSFMIKFDYNVEGLPNNFHDNTYYEINLPEELKVAGKTVQVSFRKPENDEYMNCDSSLLTYPQIFIISAK